ncbi:hypothetical protein KY290_012560 [Solanum tuberosum]|uniref:Uncharacterized protein n=1 Tax=Solanum tuberosum TaxID=4113 RepID=A0ABQ7VVB7_SOLTU|nr:hypothetical protein KY290_012560 [Solanum tuberosum]
MLLHYNNPASRRLYITSFTHPDTGFYITTAPPIEGFYITSFTQSGTGFYITTAPPAGGLTLQTLHSRIQAFTLQQPRQPEALHYKLYTTGYRFSITTAPPAGGITLQALHSQMQAFTLQLPRQSRASTLQVTLPTSHSQHKKRTKHYNEELPLSSKLGQVSAMLNITSYVKDSLSKLNSTRLSKVQI